MGLFDVSDVNNSVRLHQEVIGHRGSWVSVMHDPRILLFSRDSNLFVIPVSVNEFTSEPVSPTIRVPLVFDGVYVYDLSLAGGFQLQGRISHNVPDLVSASGEYPDYGYSIWRSLCIAQGLYTLSHYRMFIHNLSDLEELRRIYYWK